MWGIHNNRPEIDPVADGAVRIGWDDMGDLSPIPASREAFKEAVTARLRAVEPGQLPSTAGTLYRFVHELAVGDVVVCPNRKKSTIDIGTIAGPYQFRADALVHKHWRPVTWVTTGIPRTELSEAGQNEISSATTLFQITTAEAEIGHFMTVPSRDEKPDYTWVDFYPQLVDAILAYKDDRTTLLERLWNVAKASGREKLFKYLQSDHYTDGNKGPIRDVDPFTIMTTFNRGITQAARADIVRAFKQEFSIAAPAPTTFPGVPLVNNLSSWFFRWEDERDPHEIPALWEMCEAAIAYADSATEATRERLVAAFDAAAAGGRTGKLTMGLFWSRPKDFGAYDSLNTSHLQTTYPDLAARLSLSGRLDGDTFLANTETFRAWLDDPNSPVDSFPEFSHDAFLAAVAESAKDDDSDTPVTPAAEPSAPAPAPAVEAQHEPYDVSAIRDDGGFVSESELEAMLERLRAKKNLILQGPPGTGKTWLARRLAWALCDERQSPRVQVVQFHPSLAYEDFVRGWRPSGDGRLVLADGPFINLCVKAKDDPTSKYVLVIEEINRGNPAQIFGELLTLMEADKRSPESAMRLAYPRDNERFYVPANLYIIGTMNVADRSLAIVDMALRRRFAFIELAPAFGDDWVQHVSGLGYDLELLETYGKRLRDLNEQIARDSNLGRQYGVGHSYFTPRLPLAASGLNTQQWWQRVVETDVRPLLDEYWFDRPDVADKAVAQLLGAQP